MVTLIYRSEATRPMSTADLAELCLSSARTNQALGITGFLLHMDGLFLQILEGRADAVEPLFGKILADKRHHRVEVLLHEEGDEKHNFAFWAMNLGPLDDPDFRSKVLGPGLTREAFATRSHETDFALDALMRAYLEACVTEDVDPAAHDPTGGTIPVWLLPARGGSGMPAGASPPPAGR